LKAAGVLHPKFFDILKKSIVNLIIYWLTGIRAVGKGFLLEILSQDETNISDRI